MKLRSMTLLKENSVRTISRGILYITTIISAFYFGHFETVRLILVDDKTIRTVWRCEQIYARIYSDFNDMRLQTLLCVLLGGTWWPFLVTVFAGNCWFMGAAASIAATNRKLLMRVIMPVKQGFGRDYTGRCCYAASGLSSDQFILNKKNCCLMSYSQESVIFSWAHIGIIRPQTTKACQVTDFHYSKLDSKQPCGEERNKTSRSKS